MISKEKVEKMILSLIRLFDLEQFCLLSLFGLSKMYLAIKKLKEVLKHQYAIKMLIRIDIQNSKQHKLYCSIRGMNFNKHSQLYHLNCLTIVQAGYDFIFCGLNQIQRGWGGGSGPPLKITKYIEFLSNTEPDSLKNHKAAKPAFNFGPSSARP